MNSLSDAYGRSFETGNPATNAVIRATNAEPPGLHGKYIIYRASDEAPVPYSCFVLRIDGTDGAAMRALEAYALATRDQALKSDLMRLVDRYRNSSTPAGSALRETAINPLDRTALATLLRELISEVEYAELNCDLALDDNTLPARARAAADQLQPQEQS
jgi:hypothetical protein